MDKNEIVNQLRAGFEQRAAALETILRTKWVTWEDGGGGSSLQDVRKLGDDPKTGWRKTLLKALDYVKAPPSPHPEADGVVQDAAVKKVAGQPGAASTGSQGSDQQDGQPRESVSWDIKRLISQHLLFCYLIIPRLRGDYQEWLNWIPNEALSLYDATALEILSGRAVLGDAAVVAYNASLAAARDHHGVYEISEGVLDLQENLQARKVTTRLLRKVSASKRENLLWGFIRDANAMFDGISKVLDLAKSKLSWLDRMTHNLRRAWVRFLNDDSLSAGTTAKEPLSSQIGSEAGWLLDPGRLAGIAKAATYIMKRKSDEPARSIVAAEDAEHLAALEQTRRRVVAQGVRLTVPILERYTKDNKKDPIPSSKIESVLDDLWWLSFDGEGEDREGHPVPWTAGAVAAFCLGERRALWRARTPEDAVDRIRQVTPPLASTVRALPAAGATPLKVVVFGAGIAGLTAAHELVERGFEVAVVEAATELRQDAGHEVDVGGLARTQWAVDPPKASESTPRRAVAPPKTFARWIDANDKPNAKVDMRTGAKLFPGDTRTEAKLFPGEHGYRLFPSFYRHVFDTMKRTPILNSPEGMHPTAFDQLQATHHQVFAQRNDFVHLSRSKPRSLEAFRREYMSLADGLGFQKRDLARFFFKLLRYLMTSSERRAAEYEKMTMLEFFGPNLYSESFLRMLKATPKALVAMDAEHCDARTQGNVYLQLLLDEVLGGEYTDSTLRGPTTKAWFDIWYDYLKSMGVQFFNAELLSLSADGSSNSDDPQFYIDLKLAPLDLVEGRYRDSNKTEVEKFVFGADYHVVALDAVAAERITRSWNWAGVPYEIRGFTRNVTMDLTGMLERYEVAIVFDKPMDRDEADDLLRELLNLITFAKDDHLGDPVVRSAFRTLTNATGSIALDADTVEEVRVVLWFQRKIGKNEVALIEQAIASWIDGVDREQFISRDPQWMETPSHVTTPRMPDDDYGASPSDRFQTFSGVQYYFAQDFKLVQGHVYFPDTEWGLSAVSQSQFWLRGALPDGVRGVLSVDIGNCHQKSSFLHKSLVESSPDEIQKEVWRQIQDSLRAVRGPTSVVTSLPLPQPRYYHIDENLVFSGDVLQGNLTPFLINNVGDWGKRPKCLPWVPGSTKVVASPRTDATGVWQSDHGGYRVHAGKVVFCGTYMRTFTRMTTMEAANESARHAVNAILDYLAATQSPNYQAVAGDYCDIWNIEDYELEDLEFFKRVDKLLFAAGKPHIADILQFDRIADLQYPDATPAQALMAALGQTLGSDWGVKPPEIVAATNGLMEVAKTVARDLGVPTGGEAPIQKLLTLLGIGKSGLGGKS